MEEPLVITIDYRPEDFAAAAQWVVIRNPATYGLCATFAFLIAWLGWLIWYRGDPEGGLPLLVLSGVVPFIWIPSVLFGARRHARKVFESTPAFASPITWLLSPLDLEIRGKGVSAKLELAGYPRAVETSQAFLLWQSKAVYNCLPKRCLPDRATLVRVRDYIRRGLPGKATIKLRND